jgi:hypothetical protein
MTKTPFWQSVSELAAMRDLIPEERRRMSGVLEVFRRDVLPKSEKPSTKDQTDD